MKWRDGREIKTREREREREQGRRVMKIINGHEKGRLEE